MPLPDGVLTVTTDPVWAGVDIAVSWTGTPVPWRTTVTRTDPAGSVVTVRSGDLAYTPGGTGVVYDHEAPLEGTFTYQATGFSTSGDLVRTSTPWTVTLPAAQQTAWLKCVDKPSLSRAVILAGPLGEQWETPSEVFWVPGRRFPVVWQDVQSSLTGSMRLRVGSQAEYRDLRALSAAGVLLLQASNADYSLPGDIYLTCPKIAYDRPNNPGWELRWFDLPFVEVDRPATAGSVLRVPGWSNDVVAARYGSWTVFDAAFASYAAQAKGP